MYGLMQDEVGEEYSAIAISTSQARNCKKGPFFKAV